MPKKYELRVEAERLIHNDLSNCGWSFQQQMQRQYKENDTSGVYHTMMASLIFCAFSIEAKVNFVGWKVLQDDWPEQDRLSEKVNLLLNVLPLSLHWGERPLQTVTKLIKFRNTLAHGKPDIENEVMVLKNVTDIKNVLEAQWETTICQNFVNDCQDDEKELWDALLNAAGIGLFETLSSGGYSLKTIVESTE